MAERQNNRSGNGSTTSRSAGRNGTGSSLSGREAIERVRHEAPNVLGLAVDSIVGLERADGKGWTVTIEVVEVARIPRSTDVLGAYEVTLDAKGELVGAKRRGRYYRNEASGGDQ